MYLYAHMHTTTPAIVHAQVTTTISRGRLVWHNGVLDVQPNSGRCACVIVCFTAVFGVLLVVCFTAVFGVLLVVCCVCFACCVCAHCIVFYIYNVPTTSSTNNITPYPPRKRYKHLYGAYTPHPNPPSPCRYIPRPTHGPLFDGLTARDAQWIQEQFPYGPTPVLRAPVRVVHTAQGKKKVEAEIVDGGAGGGDEL